MDRDLRRPVRATQAKNWQLALAVVALWSLVGLVMGVLRVTLTHNANHSARMVSVAVATHWFWIPVTPLVAWLLTRFPWEANRKAAALTAHAFAFLPLLVLQPYWLNAVVHVAGGRTIPIGPLAFGQSDTNLVFYLLIVAGMSALQTYQRGIRADANAIALEGALSDAQVQVLTMQLQPHFLFNALHAVSESAFADASGARKMLFDLRALLSESFTYAARREVTLAEELRFLDSYIAIQRQRFGARVSVMVAAAPDTHHAVVPHLLLQPLVENAIRHGIASRARGGVVHVRIDRDGEKIVVYVTDDGIGLQSVDGHPAFTEGLGIAHTRMRLHALHGNDASVSLRDLNGHGAEARVVLPFRTEAREVVVVDDRTPPEKAELLVRAPRQVSVVVQFFIASVAWILVAVLWAQIGALSNFFTTERGPSFVGLLQSYLVIALAGTIVTLPALRTIKRMPVASRLSSSRTGILVLHACAALGFAFVHCCLTLVILQVLAPQFLFAREFAPLMRQGLPGWILWDALVYFVALAISNRGVLLSWHRARGLEGALAYAKLAQARVDLTRLQLQPAVLLAGLDAVYNEIAINPARAEEMIARLGDLLRRMLGGVTIDLETLTEELRSVA